VRATGAEVLAFGKRADKDCSVVPDRAIGEGDVIEGTEFGLEVLHTPGHAPNHLCFVLEEERVLFTGDHVLDGTTTVVSPQRGGDMTQYLASLERLRKLRRISRICPAHGDVIEEPQARLDEYMKHRRLRERQILKLLGEGPTKITDIVARLYTDTPEGLLDMAGRQVHAHLIKLKNEGKVEGTGVRTAWKLA
jgi:glyoxylase-like metal-dependent hydrolase (beta-lactamase superfamily II)